MKKENTMSKNLKTEAVDHLFDAILCLKDREIGRASCRERVSSPV